MREKGKYDEFLYVLNKLLEIIAVTLVALALYAFYIR